MDLIRAELLGLGVLGLAVAYALTALVNAFPMYFVLNHMMSDLHKASLKKCFICCALLPLVLIPAAIVAMIPIPILNAVCAIVVLYRGSIAVIEGTFEMTEGGLTVLILYWLTGVALGAGVRMVVPGGDPPIAAMIRESYEPEPEFGGLSYVSAEEEDWEDEAGEEEDATVEIHEIGAETAVILNTFRSEKLEKEEFPRLMQASGENLKGQIMFGVFLKLNRSLTMDDLTDDRIWLAFPAGDPEWSFEPLDDWPGEGSQYQGHGIHKIVRANPDGSIYSEDSSEAAGSDSANLLEAVSQSEEFHYYLFFHFTPPKPPAEGLLVFKTDGTVYEVMPLGEVSKAWAK